MADTVSSPRGAEISERSDELVLPGDRPLPLRVVASPEPRATAKVVHAFERLRSSRRTGIGPHLSVPKV